LFRIDRNLVKLSTMRSLSSDNESIGEAAAVGIYPDAAVSMADIALAQAQEIIDEAEQKANERAARIVDEARDDVAMLMVNAREEAEDIRRDAWQEGFADGSEEGRRSFDEKLAAKISEDDEKLRRVLQELNDARERVYEGLEKDVVELAMGIVKKVIDPVGDDFGGVFEALIKNALKQINPDGKVVLRVCTADYERFFPTGNARFELDEGVTVSASILKDSMLGSGDLIIDTGDVTVNAGVDTQLKYISLAFERL